MVDIQVMDLVDLAHSRLFFFPDMTAASEEDINSLQPPKFCRSRQKFANLACWSALHSGSHQ